MKYFVRQRFSAKIQALLDQIGDREIPTVERSAPFEEILEAITRFTRSQMIYVVDEKGRLAGTLSLDTIVRHSFFEHLELDVDPWRIMRQITEERAEELMRRKNLTARPEEEVQKVLHRMIEAEFREIAVVDGSGRLLGDVTMVDIIRFLMRNGGD